MLGRLCLSLLTATSLFALLAAPQAASAKTLRYAESGEAASMDPHSMREDFTQMFLANTYETLARWDRNLKLEPALAESWEVLDPKTWRFHLRQGVTFHNGNPFTADDVVFSFERASAEGSAFAGLLESIERMEKVDDHTVDVHLRQPNSVLLNDLAGWFIMDKEWLVENKAEKPVDITTGKGAFTVTHANGTGPFMLESRKPDVRTVLKANPDWWDKPEHNLTEIVYTPIASDATRVAALLSGEVDFIRNTPVQDIARIESTPGMKILRGPHLRIVFFGMDLQSDRLPGAGVEGNPLKELKVRQAILQAIDIEGIKRSLMRGNSRPAGLIIAPELPFYDAAYEQRPPYDPERAKELLSEAGYAEGFTLPMDCPQGALIKDAEICSAVVGMLGRIGIKVDLTLHPPVQYWAGVPGGAYSFYLTGWAGIPTLDPINTFSANLATTSGDLGAWNIRGFSNPRVDELIPQIWAEYDSTKRQAMISEILEISKEQVAKIPLHQQFLSWGMRDSVDGIVPGDEYTRFMYFTVND